MPDSFFQSDKKRKRPARAGPSTSRRGGGTRKPQRQARKEDNESISSGSSDERLDVDTFDFRANREDDDLSDDGIVDENETAAEKRVRLAKGYLAKVRGELEAAQDEAGFDAAEIDKELLASRLQKDVAEASGKIHAYIASHLSSVRTTFLKTPSHIPTSVTIGASALFVSTKRGTIIRHALPSLKRAGQPFGRAPKVVPGEAAQGHRGELLALASSEDGKYLVSGGRDKVIGVWNVEGDEPKWVAGIKGHKDAITSIALPPLDNTSYEIFTASLSRHLGVHSLATLSIIDTLFGHQDSIPCVSALRPSIAVTAGSRDRTCRWWKVEEEVQLVLRGGGRTFEGRQGLQREKAKERLGGGYMPGEEPTEADLQREVADKEASRAGKEYVEGSIDAVAMLDDSHFVSGGDSGSISLWHTGKKKPIFTQAFAHGIAPPTEGSGGVAQARWITALAALRGTDLFVSGSWDGAVRVWALDPSLRNFKPATIPEVPVPGFINALQILALPATSISSDNWTTGVQRMTDQDAEKSDDAPHPSRKAAKEVVMVAAVAQEPRLGRWSVLKDGVKNGVLAAHLVLDSSGQQMLV